MNLFIKKLFFIGIVIATFFGTYSLLIEPYSLTTTKYRINIPSLSGLKIIFASDFHIGPYFFEQWRLQKIITAINRENADIVILGGDYVKGHCKESSMSIDNIAASLSKIKSQSGIFAVLGNHDSYYDKDEVKGSLLAHGINVLDNENKRISIGDKFLYIAGVSDYYTDKPDIHAALKNTRKPTILVTHSPDVLPQTPKVDLVLAGHTHGGQIVIPFIGAPLVPSDYGNRYRYGLIRENGNSLIVTQGLGTSLLPIRFNCRPEIIIIEIQ